MPSSLWLHWEYGLPCRWRGNARSRNMSTNNPRRARVAEGPPSPWVNKHKNVSQEFQRLYSVSNPPRPITDFFGDLRFTVSALQGLVREAIRDKVTLRAIGGGWSLSRAAVTDGRLIDT